MTQEKNAAAVIALQKDIEQLETPVLVIPQGFPGAEEIRKNVEKFLKKGSTRVAHLIMLIHEDDSKSG